MKRIFGLMAAAAIGMHRRGVSVFQTGIGTILILNLVITFTIPGISIGGHLGGLAGGALAILALSQFGKRSAVHSRFDLVSIASMFAIGVVSVAVAYWKVKGYA